jgi:hypothetical protein
LLVSVKQKYLINHVSAEALTTGRVIPSGTNSQIKSLILSKSSHPIIFPKTIGRYQQLTGKYSVTCVQLTKDGIDNDSFAYS